MRGGVGRVPHSEKYYDIEYLHRPNTMFVCIIVCMNLMKRVNITLDPDSIELLKAFKRDGFNSSYIIRKSIAAYNAAYKPTKVSKELTKDDMFNLLDNLGKTPGEICNEHEQTYFSCWKRHI
jgi:hypothetical protein